MVRNEVIKWLDANIRYAISDSEWVNPTQVVAKKSWGIGVRPGLPRVFKGQRTAKKEHDFIASLVRPPNHLPDQ